MSSVYFFVLLYILCNSMQGNAMKFPRGMNDTVMTSSVITTIETTRTRYGIDRELTYDSKAKRDENNSMILKTVVPIKEKLDKSTEDEEFWRAVATAWVDRFLSFFTIQWTEKDVKCELGLLYYLHIFSPQTEYVFIEKEKNGDIVNGDEYSVTTYFYPRLPLTTTESAVAFRFIDALHLLNSARTSLNASKLKLNDEKMAMAHRIVQSLEYSVANYYSPVEIVNRFGSEIYADEKNNEGDLQLLENSGTYSIFIYKIPKNEDLTKYLTKFPYALMEDFLFTAYKESSQHYENDPLYYTQIRRDFYQLLNPQINDIGMNAKIIARVGNIYCLFVICHENRKFIKSEMCKLESFVKQDGFNGRAIASTSVRYNEIEKHINTLPQLDLKNNLMRYKKADMSTLEAEYRS